jgi:hypothetical protein
MSFDEGCMMYMSPHMRGRGTSEPSYTPRIEPQLSLAEVPLSVLQQNLNYNRVPTGRGFVIIFLCWSVVKQP